MKNMQIIDTFEKEITSLPITIQFAKDRKFEEAWIINRNDPQPSEEEIEKYLDDQFNLLIVEYKWQEDEDASPYVLTVFLDERCKLQDRRLFIKKCLGFFYEYKDFSTLINDYNKQIIGRESLLSTPIEGIRMGVFNHWMSVGPIDLWNIGEKLDLNAIKNKIIARPEVEKTDLNFQSLFFVFNVDGKNGFPYHGIKTPSSNRVGKVWVVDYERVEFWIRNLLAVKINTDITQ